MSSAIHKKANKHAMEIKAKLLTAESQLLAAESKVREFHADALCLHARFPSLTAPQHLDTEHQAHVCLPRLP